MCDHANDPGGREAAMVEAAPGAYCDPCIAPIVAALNTGDLRTVASCCGHGKRPGKIALADGRELFIAADFDQARRFDDLLAGAVSAPEPYVCPRCGLESDEPFTWAHRPLGSDVRTCGADPVPASEVEAARERREREFWEAMIRIARAESWLSALSRGSLSRPDQGGPDG